MKWEPTSDTPIEIGPEAESIAKVITPSGEIFGTATIFADDGGVSKSQRAVRFNEDGTITSLWEPPGPADHVCAGQRLIDLIAVSPDGTHALVTGSHDHLCPGDPWLVTAGDAISLADCMPDAWRQGANQVDNGSGNQVGNGSTVVGRGHDGLPVVWKDGACTHLPVPEATPSGYATAINTDGGVVGTVGDAQGRGHGVMWSADGTFAFIDDLLAENLQRQIFPVYALATDGSILAGVTMNGEYKDGIVRPMTTQVVPDLDQGPPSEVSTYSTRTGTGKRFRLGFESAVDNVGAGPLLIDAHRNATSEPDMTADQQVPRADGSERTYPDIGVVRFTESSWRLLRFDRYELRRASDYSLIAKRDTSFCLHDGYDSDPDQRLPSEPNEAQITTDCGAGEPELLSIRQGISVGYGVSQASGSQEFLDVTGLAAGRYYLVHRVNKERTIVESSYTNNASSLLIKIRWPNGTRKTPSVGVLKECPNKDRCPD